MKIQSKLKIIILIALVLISIRSVAFGRYVLEIGNREIANVNIKTVRFYIDNISKYGSFDLYIDGNKISSDITNLSKNYLIGTRYEIKNIKVNDGYTLITNANDFSGILNENKNLNITFNTNSYAISYNLNGGSIENKIETFNVETENFVLPIPTKTGYTFTGWTGTGVTNATKNLTILKGSTGDRNYIANWTPTNYSVNYNLNGGSISGQKTSYNVESESFNLVEPTRNGYTFTGWTGTDLSSPTKNVTISKGSLGDKSYTANWSPINYSISYNANGGSISGQRTSYNIETGTFNLVTPSRTGYSFTGWTGTGLGWASTTVTISKGSTGDRSYTANWVDNIRPDIYGAWITSGPTYEVRSSGYGYRVNIQVSCGDSGSGINRVLTYYESGGSWVGETNITSSMTDSFWFKPGYRQIRIVVFDNAGNSSETVIGVQCG